MFRLSETAAGSYAYADADGGIVVRHRFARAAESFWDVVVSRLGVRAGRRWRTRQGARWDRRRPAAPAETTGSGLH